MAQELGQSLGNQLMRIYMEGHQSDFGNEILDALVKDCSLPLKLKVSRWIADEHYKASILRDRSRINTKTTKSIRKTRVENCLVMEDIRELVASIKKEHARSEELNKQYANNPIHGMCERTMAKYHRLLDRRNYCLRFLAHQKEPKAKNSEALTALPSKVISQVEAVTDMT